MRSVPRTAAPHNPLRARDLNRERVAVYARVSSDEQAQAGTIQNQIAFARRYCDLHGLPIAAIYADEGVSGTVPLAERPAGARLLADAQAGQFGAALVYRIDRLARSTRVLLDAHDALKANRVALRSMTEPFDTASPLGEFIMTLLGSLAALERATIVERMTLGKHRAAREGRWLGGAPVRLPRRGAGARPAAGRPPRGSRRGAAHLPPVRPRGHGADPHHGTAERRGGAVALRQPGDHDKRWPEQARRWTTGTLSRLLRNTAYIGRYRASARAGKEIAEYATPRIVDDETFAAAQRLLRERFIEATRNARRFYLLRGLIRCHCGRTVVGDGSRRRHQFYYACPAGHFRQRAEVLEAVVVQEHRGVGSEPRFAHRAPAGTAARTAGRGPRGGRGAAAPAGAARGEGAGGGCGDHPLPQGAHRRGVARRPARRAGCRDRHAPGTAASLVRAPGCRAGPGDGAALCRDAAGPAPGAGRLPGARGRGGSRPPAPGDRQAAGGADRGAGRRHARRALPLRGAGGLFCARFRGGVPGQAPATRMASRRARARR